MAPFPFAGHAHQRSHFAINAVRAVFHIVGSAGYEAADLFVGTCGLISDHGAATTSHARVREIHDTGADGGRPDQTKNSSEVHGLPPEDCLHRSFQAADFADHTDSIRIIREFRG